MRRIPRCGLKAFRHMHASLLVNDGAPVTVAQAQLGHADPRVTLGIYSHVIGGSHRNAVEKIAVILDPNGPKPEISSKWIQEVSWGERWDLNPRPSVPQTDALPAELRSPLQKF